MARPTSTQPTEGELQIVQQARASRKASPDELAEVRRKLDELEGKTR